MSIQVDPSLLKTLHRYGAFDIHACFNCGTCTAVCPLSKDGGGFPRRVIRLGQVGARARLLGSKEIWQCFHCGQCSESCPRQAQPGEFMAAARRHAIASADPTGISRMLYTSRLFAVLFLGGLTALLAVVLVSGHGPMAQARPMLFQYHQIEGFLSYQVVHNLGLGIIFVAAAAMAVGVVRMALNVSRSLPEGFHVEGDRGTRAYRAVAAVMRELAMHDSFRSCDDERSAPWYASRRFLHWCIMWGFLGLLVATGANWALDMTVGKTPGQAVALWHPTRLLGTVSGLFMVYGTAAAIAQRWRKAEQAFAQTFVSDWLFLWMLLLAGLTGFVVEIAVYLPIGATWMYIALLVHVVISMEVVLLLPFSKLAHAVYRPVALFVHHYLQPAPAPQSEHVPHAAT